MTAEAQIDAQQLRDGDLVMVHMPRNTSMEDVEAAHQAVFRGIAAALNIVVAVVVLPEGVTLDTIPARELRAAGLVRINDVGGTP